MPLMAADDAATSFCVVGRSRLPFFISVGLTALCFRCGGKRVEAKQPRAAARGCTPKRVWLGRLCSATTSQCRRQLQTLVRRPPPKVLPEYSGAAHHRPLVGSLTAQRVAPLRRDLRAARRPRNCGFRAHLLSLFFTRHIFSSPVNEPVQPLGARRLGTTRGHRAASSFPARVALGARSRAGHRALFRRGDLLSRILHLRSSPRRTAGEPIPRARVRARCRQTLRYENNKSKPLRAWCA